MIATIRGDMTIVVPLGGHADQATLVNGRNGELRNDHPYVSAVLVVHDLGDGAYRSDAYITNSSNAAPLPSALFAGPKDAFYDYEASLDAYVPRAQGARGQGRSIAVRAEWALTAAALNCPQT